MEIRRDGARDIERDGKEYVNTKRGRESLKERDNE